MPPLYHGARQAKNRRLSTESARRSGIAVIREAFNAAVSLGRSSCREQAFSAAAICCTEALCGAPLIGVTASFRGVLARADIPLRTAYRLIEAI